MFDTTEALDSSEITPGGHDVLIRGVKELPSAFGEMAVEAWDDKWGTAGHALKTVGTAATMGAVLGAILPSRGPAAAITGIAFSIPLVIGGIGKVRDAYKAAQQPGADLDLVAHQLARDAIGGTAELGLGFAGGWAGARAGSSLAVSETAIGGRLQGVQRLIIKGENKALIGIARTPDFVASKLPESISSRFFGTAKQTGLSGEVSTGAALAETAAPALGGEVSFASPSTGVRAWFAGKNSATQNRLTQLTTDGETLTMYRGSLHGHSRYSDGTGLPPEIYAKAKADGMDFYAITDHNHLAARSGIKPGDPRLNDQAGTPVLAENPISYAQTFADARAATVDGEFVGLVGIEMGTIGKVGGHSHGGSKGFHDPDGPGVSLHSHDGHSQGSPDEIKLPQLPGMTEPPVTGRVPEAGKTPGFELPPAEVPPAQFIQGTDIPIPKIGDRALTLQEKALVDAAARDASHWGGVNHVNLFEVPTFYEAIRVPRPRGFADFFMDPFRRLTGRQPEVVVKAPDVVKYNDGDYATMIQHLKQTPDTSGKPAIIQLNHPRYTEDWNPNLPVAARGRDYGIKSFKNRKEWQEQFGQHASQIEIITGQAMNPHPVDVMKAGDIAPINLAGYVDKGLRISPTYGRDDHFLLPGGRPAGTGIFARDLSRDALLDAMRARRTIASTNIRDLNGHMTVNDKHAMGAVLDQNAVHDLNFKMNFGGNHFTPEAQYKINLWSDRRVGDGRLAKIVQTREVTGADLIQAGGVVPFDMARHTLGNKSAWYIEVQRTNPISSHVDHMWTAPIWIEPLAAGQHSLLTRGLVGTGAMFMQ